MADWMEQQISDAGDGDSGEDVQPKSQEEFASQIRTMVATDSIEKLSISLLRDRLSEVGEVEALEQGLDADSREEAQELYSDAMRELGALEEEDEDEDEAEAEEPDTDTDDSASPFDSDPAEQAETESESDSDSDTDESTDSPTVTDDSEDELPEAEPIDDQLENMTTETHETPESTEPEQTGTTSVSDGGTEGIVNVKDIAPGVMTADDAAERDPRYTMLVWADPGQGKTHFACTGPEPVVIIDTEGKADQVARKFQGEGDVPQSPFIFQPTDYDEAVEALDSAMDILDEYRNKTDTTGTLVVDSMSVMWGWAQQKYVQKFYPGKDAEEVEFSSAFGGGQSDWKQIKRYHNVKFRQIMLDSPYHLIWTAMREDDYEEAMKGNKGADKPSGEKENPYKVDEVLRIEEGEDGAPVGILNKSGKIKHRYSGLRYPTFGKHKELVSNILDAEGGGRSINAVAGAKGVGVHEGNPKFEQDDE